jgi:hypothetical protein
MPSTPKLHLYTFIFPSDSSSILSTSTVKPARYHLRSHRYQSHMLASCHRPPPAASCALDECLIHCDSQSRLPSAPWAVLSRIYKNLSTSDFDFSSFLNQPPFRSVCPFVQDVSLRSDALSFAQALSTFRDRLCLSHFYLHSLTNPKMIGHRRSMSTVVIFSAC